jgi:hypothetical protein
VFVICTSVRDTQESYEARLHCGQFRKIILLSDTKEACSVTNPLCIVFPVNIQHKYEDNRNHNNILMYFILNLRQSSQYLSALNFFIFFVEINIRLRVCIWLYLGHFICMIDIYS